MIAFPMNFDHSGTSEGNATMTKRSELPIAVIGGGPIGLAAAAHLIERGAPVKALRGGSRHRGKCARLGPCTAVLALALQYR